MAILPEEIDEGASGYEDHEEEEEELEPAVSRGWRRRYRRYLQLPGKDEG